MGSTPNRHTKPRRRSIHFFFAPHPPGESYLPRKASVRGVKTHIVEEGLGRGYSIRSSPDAAKFNRTKEAYLRKAARRGTRILTGEENWFDESLEGRLERNHDILELVLNHPSVNNIRYYFEDLAHWYNERHRFIQGNVDYILEEGGMPATARYGGLHSLLSARLQSKNIRTSRTISPQVFTFGDALTRRLMRGTAPEKISALDYKRAFVSVLVDIPEIRARITGKVDARLTAKDYQRFTLITRTMIQSLTESELDHALRERDFSFIAQKNKLGDWDPTSKARARIRRFLMKKSSFYRHQYWARKNRKKLGKSD